MNYPWGRTSPVGDRPGRSYERGNDRMSGPGYGPGPNYDRMPGQNYGPGPNYDLMHGPNYGPGPGYGCEGPLIEPASQSQM